MRFFSILKTSRNRQFDYQPRYYDPAKEDLQNRVKEIEARLKAEKEGNALEGVAHYQSRMARAFRDQRHHKTPSFWKGFASSAAFVRMVIALFLVGGGYFFLEYGDRIEQLSFVNATPLSIVIVGFIFLYALSRFQNIHRRR
ncbi:MAG: hypothetical protein HC913_03655 [Microscillaceae bacterium]|nr:hypothetical protein [Microscillaceae bacterium]